MSWNTTNLYMAINVIPRYFVLFNQIRDHKTFCSLIISSVVDMCNCLHCIGLSDMYGCFSFHLLAI